MELGYFTMPLHPPGSNLTQTLEDDLQQMITLDKLGYREAWIGEHFTAQWENIPAPDLFIAQALGLTDNIIFGTGVSCLPNHNPFMLAHRIAQLDHMAKGRFHWGVGSGGFVGDFEVFGFDPSKGEHLAMSRDSLELVLQLWQDPKPGRYKSKYWDFNVPETIGEIGLDLHVRPYQLPHPPIGVAGVSPNSGTLVVAGERGFIPMSINIVPPSVIGTHWEAVERGAEKAGRVPDRSAWRIAREVYVAETTEQARKEVMEGTLARDFAQYFMRMLPYTKRIDLLKDDPDMPDSDVTLDYVLDNIFIVGSPDHVVERLEELYHNVGGFGILLTMGHEWEPREQWERSITLLKNEVIPRLP